MWPAKQSEGRTKHPGGCAEESDAIVPRRVPLLLPGGKWHQPVGRRGGKNRQLASAHGVAEIQAKGHKAFGFVAWHGADCVALALC